MRLNIFLLFSSTGLINNFFLIVCLLLGTNNDKNSALLLQQVYSGWICDLHFSLYSLASQKYNLLFRRKILPVPHGPVSHKTRMRRNLWPTMVWRWILSATITAHTAPSSTGQGWGCHRVSLGWGMSQITAFQIWKICTSYLWLHLITEAQMPPESLTEGGKLYFKASSVHRKTKKEDTTLSLLSLFINLNQSGKGLS